jgi:hypothetical protein
MSFQLSSDTFLADKPVLLRTQSAYQERSVGNGCMEFTVLFVR